MKRSRSTEEERIVAVLREQEAGVATAEACREHGAGGATFHAWKAKYGGSGVPQARGPQAPGEGSARLGKPLAEAVPDNAALRDVTAENR
ncbi:MAG: transposase [Acetobacteraceae bacterium]|nr:transposase [Acetobacteraceae bacterium]